MGFLAEFTLSQARFFASCFAKATQDKSLRMTGGEGLGMTAGAAVVLKQPLRLRRIRAG